MRNVIVTMAFALMGILAACATDQGANAPALTPDIRGAWKLADSQPGDSLEVMFLFTDSVAYNYVKQSNRNDTSSIPYRLDGDNLNLDGRIVKITKLTETELVWDDLVKLERIPQKDFVEKAEKSQFLPYQGAGTIN